MTARRARKKICVFIIGKGAVCVTGVENIILRAYECVVWKKTTGCENWVVRIFMGKFVGLPPWIEFSSVRRKS